MEYAEMPVQEALLFVSLSGKPFILVQLANHRYIPYVKMIEHFEDPYDMRHAYPDFLALVTYLKYNEFVLERFEEDKRFDLACFRFLPCKVVTVPVEKERIHGRFPI